ncbi:MAG: hypothetical protein J0H65_16725 [Rhizobiales bacterium]|nr:hypothetical protein [Hyphomicrobiales bacterium]
MSRRRFVDPSQRSIFDVIASPEVSPKTKNEAASKPRPDPPPSSPDPAPVQPSGPAPRYAVYRPRRLLWTTVFGTILAAFRIIPQPEQPTASYNLGVFVIGLVVGMALIIPFMLIPWTKGRCVFRWFESRRAAQTVQTAFVVIPLIFASALGLYAYDVAGDDILRTYRETTTRLEDEAVKRDWEKKTRTVPSQSPGS